jgi:FkbM family methyltransferase
MSINTKMQDAVDVVNGIHKLYPVFGRKEWGQEINEQQMIAAVLDGDEVVLELGACIGRTTIVIGHLLIGKGGRLVTVESNPDNIPRLTSAVRSSGIANIQISSKPISKHRVVVRRWDSKTVADDEAPPEGWLEVPTTTLNELRTSHSVNAFDTLVIDCEGAFYEIVRDFPDIMNGVTKVMIENDFTIKSQADYVHSAFRKHGLEPIWSANGGMPRHVCKSCFWQIWRKPEA